MLLTSLQGDTLYPKITAAQFSKQPYRRILHQPVELCYVFSYKNQGSSGSTLSSSRIDAWKQVLPTSHTAELVNVDHNHVEKDYLVFKLKM